MARFCPWNAVNICQQCSLRQIIEIFPEVAESVFLWTGNLSHSPKGPLVRITDLINRRGDYWKVKTKILVRWSNDYLGSACLSEPFLSIEVYRNLKFVPVDLEFIHNMRLLGEYSKKRELRKGIFSLHLLFSAR